MNKKIISILFLVLGLAACGQKGPLTQPVPAEPEQTSQPAQ